MLKTRWSQAMLVCLVLLGAASSWLLAQRHQPTPETQMPLIGVNDLAKIEANWNHEVVIEGTVSTAAWSRTGAVMNIDFADAPDSRMMAVIFQRSRESIDAGYAGDVARALTGAKVRIRGKLEEYGGSVPSFRGRPQVIINSGDQISILQLAPTTQP